MYCTLYNFSLLFQHWTCSSSRDPEPRPSLESSNHSGLDLMLASIVESDLVFGYVSFSVSALNIQR